MKERNPIWNSVGLLIGVLIAILAIVRGRWQLPLLILAVSVWALWVVYSLVVLPQKGKAGYKRHGKKTADIDRTMAEMVLRHVNYRITDRLKTAYPNARWEWLMRDPALFVVQGGTGVSVFTVSRNMITPILRWIRAANFPAFPSDTAPWRLRPASFRCPVPIGASRTVSGASG